MDGASVWWRSRMRWSRTSSADAIEAGVAPDRIGKKKSKGAPWQNVDEKDYAAFIAQAGGCVIGGTAWDFANAGRVPRLSLDLLVVEEAGQYSLANTIAVAPSARNLMLLGDPQQLPRSARAAIPSR